jgi:hypothetical protein
MKNKIFLLTLVLSVIFFASFIIIFSPVGKKNIIKTTPTPIIDTSTWKTYSNKLYSIEFQHPQYYQVKGYENDEFYDTSLVVLDQRDKATDPITQKQVASNVLIISREDNLNKICPDNICKFYDPVTVGNNSFTKFSEGLGGYSYYTSGVLIYSFLTEDTDPVLHEILSTFKFTQ